MDGTAKATAIVAAAGSGLRLGAGRPKALVELAGRPLLRWSLDAMRAAERISAILVAAPAGHEAEIEAVCDASGAECRVLTGGDSRSQSVAAALEVAEGEMVAVHDAARPLVTAQLIDELVAKLEARPEAAAVIAAAPLTDTVKRAGEGGEVAETLDRSVLWAAQTPQVFRAAALREAQAGADLAAATDDAMLVEGAGGTVLLHEAPATNLKVTAPLDLRIAELLLGTTAG